MQFGIRECTDIVFRSTDTRWIGKQQFKKGQPVLYIDSAKTSTLEGAGTTVYATGGKGNTRLLTWEGEKTLTFTVEDALMSQLGFSILSGAGLFEDNIKMAHFHQAAKVPVEIQGSTNTTKVRTYYQWIETDSENQKGYAKPISLTDSAAAALDFDNENDADYMAELSAAPGATSAEDTAITKPADFGSRIYGYYDKNIAAGTAKIDLRTILGSKHVCADAPIYISIFDENDNYLGTAHITNPNTTTYTDENSNSYLVYDTAETAWTIVGNPIQDGGSSLELTDGQKAIVDCYVLAKENKVNELQIDAEHFAGYFYVEANTLVKRRSDGRDLPAVITLPKVKIQSNFSITFASSGDPSTFTFTMDAMPGYTYFNNADEVLCVFQIFEDDAAKDTRTAVMRHIDYHVGRRTGASDIGNEANPGT